jgi:tetratricopeptide (TPR) repeat protein
MREARQGPDRSRAIVVTEIAQLEALERAADAATIQGEAAADGDRSAILRRLATTYGELAQLAQAEGAATLAQRSREKAKEKELLLVRSYPDAPNMEDVYFALADELEREGHLPDSFVQYYELTHRYPRSRFAPAAYVAFAEEHFTFAEKYPDEWPRTIALYEKAVELSAPRNREYGYALYKLAWAKQKSGDHASAVATFQKVIAASAASPGDAELAKMADASRSDLSIL